MYLENISLLLDLKIRIHCKTVSEGRDAIYILLRGPRMVA